MTPAETAALLTVVATFDRRNLAEGDVHAWHATLNDLPFDACRDATVEHYRRETVWLMPAHLRRLVSAQRNDRASRSLDSAQGLEPKPPWFDAAVAAFRKGDRAEGERIIAAGRTADA